MGRRRILLDGVPYHVTARANRKEDLLETDHAKNYFVEILAKTKRKCSFSLDNFIVMDIHIHLLIWPSLGETPGNVAYSGQTRKRCLEYGTWAGITHRFPPNSGSA